MSSPGRFTSAVEVVANIRSGSACAILVEGEERGSDAWILSYILKERVGEEVVFYGRDGRINLLAELPYFVSQLRNGQLAAVLDRDFADEATVAQTRAPDYAGHLFYWQWSCIEKFLLEWAQRLAPQTTGNWVISDLTREAAPHGVSITARTYFNDLTQRDSAWVLARLSEHYGGWSHGLPELFSPEALNARFEDRWANVAAKINTRPSAHEVISGKLLLKTLYLEMPSGPKPPREHVRNRLVRMASKQAPDDIRSLVEDHILPRWRRARAG